MTTPHTLAHRQGPRLGHCVERVHLLVVRVGFRFDLIHLKTRSASFLPARIIITHLRSRSRHPNTQTTNRQTMGVSKAWGLFDDKGAEALRNYKYVGVDKSLSYK